MVYVQHLLGIGHLMRARKLAQALAGAAFDVHLVSGGMPIGGQLPRGVRITQLPPIRVSDASFTPLRDAQFQPIDDDYRDRRRDALLAAYDATRPAAVIFETFPFGRRSLRFELFPLLERITATRPRPMVVSSIREILQLQQKPEREREMLDWASRWVDAIFVHGAPRFARFEDTFSFANEGSNRSYPFIGAPDGHHDLSHHGDDAEKLTLDRFEALVADGLGVSPDDEATLSWLGTSSP